MKNKKLILSITAGILFSTSLGGYFIYSQSNQEAQPVTEKVAKKKMTKDEAKKDSPLSKAEQKQIEKIQSEENPNSILSKSFNSEERNLLSQIRSNDTEKLIASAEQKGKESDLVLVSADDDKPQVVPLPNKPTEPTKPTEPLPGDNGNNGGGNGGEIEPPAVINTPPILETQPLSFHVGSVFNEETVRQSVNAYDEEDGDLTDLVRIDLSSVNANVEGTYPIVYSVTDSNNATVTVTNYVTVLNVAPEIRNARDKVIHVNEVFSLERALQGVSVYDYEEGDITDKLQVDQVQLKAIQEALMRKIEGSFTLTYLVSDSYGKSDRKSVTITIVNEAPEFTGLTDLKVSLGQEFTLEKALAGVTANDYEDGNITESIQVNEDQLMAIQEALAGNEEGRFELTYSVKDSSGKETSKIRFIDVVNEAPVITIESNAITLNVGDVFNALAGVTAYDNEDGDITDKITVINNVDTSIAGIYTVEYNVTDSNGKNAETAYLTVTILDNEDGGSVENNK